MKQADRDKRNNLVRRRIKAGDTLQDIATKLGLTESAMSRWCSRHQIELPVGRGRRPDLDLHASIRAMITEGKDNPSIAAALGCGAYTVRRIRAKMISDGLAVAPSQEPGTYERPDTFTDLAAQIIQLRSGGMAHSLIAEILKTHKNVVAKVLKRYASKAE